MPQPRLPPEIVGHIFRFLHPYRLWVLAAVCREFYQQAWGAGLVIRRELLWRADGNCETQLSQFSEVVDHVVANDLRLFLILAFNQYAPVDATVLGTPLSNVLRLIPVALPYVVSLYMSIHGPPDHDIFRALYHHAPHLQTLEMHIFPDVNTGYTEIPVWRTDLFGRHAPKLRYVTLNGVHRFADPIAAFASVVSLTIIGAALCPDTVLAQHFPALRWLFLSDPIGSSSPTATIPYHLYAAQLEWLVIAERVSGDFMYQLLGGNHAVDIPNVEYRGKKVQWTETLWRRTNDGPFSIRISARSPGYTGDVMIFIVPEHRRWYRAYELLGLLSYMEFPVSDLPGVMRRLTYLRLDNHHVTGFLACSDCVFEALAVMQLDFQPGGTQSSMVWPPDWIDTFDDEVSFYPSDRSAPTFANESYSYVECPSLKTLRLFAMYTQMSVACQEVGYLGRALSQCTRPEENRAALELHGVALGPNIQCGLLEEAYSAVGHHEFSGRNSPAGGDRGLWDGAYSCPFP